MQAKSWRERYQPLDPVSGSEATLRGRDPRSNAPVLIHLLGAAAGPSRAILHELMALPPGAYMHVVEFGEESGTCFVVTDLELGEVEMAEWLKRARSGAVPVEERPTEEIAVPVLPPAAAPPAPQEPGEFTRLFKPATVKRPATAPPVAPVVTAAPGEFTRIFSAPTAPPPSLPVPTRQNGELTSLFDRKVSPPAIEPPPPVEALPSSAPPAISEPGDFTRLLGMPPAPVPPPIAAPSPIPAPVHEPGEYTRLVTTQCADPAPLPPPPSQPAAQPARRSDRRPILIFSALATIAIVLILLAALGR
jgi:hypothetical protein